VRRYRASAISCTGAATRTVVLLGLVRRAAPKSGQLAVAEAVLAEVRRESLSEPNIDFAALEACAGGGQLRPRAAPARLRPSTHDAVAVCYRFVT
jgi:hypothetical protein